MSLHNIVISYRLYKSTITNKKKTFIKKKTYKKL